MRLDAESRLSEELTRLAALQVKLRRAEERYEAALAAVNGGDAPARPASTLQEMSFEDLRDLGLTVNEATRVLTLRYRGALEHASDLDRVPGLSPSSRTALERRLAG